MKRLFKIFDISAVILSIYSIWHIDFVVSFLNMGIPSNRSYFTNGFFTITQLQGYHLAIYTLTICVGYLLYRIIDLRIKANE